MVGLCLRYHVPYALENPLASYMWRSKVMREKILPFSRALDLHQCAFGSRWRKATRVIFGCVTASGDLCLTNRGRLLCRGKRGYCSFRPGRKHVVLEGK
eukprot:3675096-Pyramimonas_sp.AAC.1